MAAGLLGRLAGLSRSFLAGFHTELQLKTRPKEPLHLVAGSAGFSKTISQSHTFKQWTYGDDAYFVAKNRTADVIGERHDNVIEVIFFFLDLLSVYYYYYFLAVISL